MLKTFQLIAVKIVVVKWVTIVKFTLKDGGGSFDVKVWAKLADVAVARL